MRLVYMSIEKANKEEKVAGMSEHPDQSTWMNELTLEKKCIFWWLFCFVTESHYVVLADLGLTV